uniref:Uncharacterized protein n=1 Tax=Ficedula albicollis TaxID=59894 RepID=A0A803VVG1_FICAL
MKWVSPSCKLTQNPLQKTWEPYDNGLPAGHSAQRGGERRLGRAGGGARPRRLGSVTAGAAGWLPGQRRAPELLAPCPAEGRETELGWMSSLVAFVVFCGFVWVFYALGVLVSGRVYIRYIRLGERPKNVTVFLFWLLCSFVGLGWFFFFFSL